VNSASDISQETPYYYVYAYSGDNVEAAKAKANYATYGVLYNGPAAVIAAPKGWHVPTEEEYIKLETFLGMSEEDASDEYYFRGAHGIKMKSEDGWDDFSGESGNGNNESGFNALPAGTLAWALGAFKDKGARTFFWGSTRDDIGSYHNMYTRCLQYGDDGVLGGTYSMKSACSVRLIKDK